MTVERGFKRLALGLSGAVALLVTAALPARASTSVSACGTLSSPGSYVLTKDLSATGTCITITAEGVSLDMKKHSIKGNGTGDGISDGGSHLASMAIANGKISNFSVGIDLSTSCCAVIKSVTSSNNASTGISIEGCCSTLDAVTASGNGADGIDAAGCCYTLNNITAKGNHGIGISATDCCTSISKSTITGNGGVGVLSTGCCTFLVSSTVKKNGGEGTDMSDCCNFVVGSTVSGNKGSGIDLSNGDNLVTNTKVSKNGGDGIDLSDTENQIVNSQSSKNGGAGADVECPGAITGFTAKGNKGGSLTTTGGTCTQLNDNI